MPSKKKMNTRSKTKSAKNVRRPSKTKGKRKPAKRKRAPKRIGAKVKAGTAKKRPSVIGETELKREFQHRDPSSTHRIAPRRAEDFEGLSRAEQADSESVDELVEEGNALEAGAVAGVEEADQLDQQEVHTHEVPEDDVPEEYLDKD
jgi:hypothetical protein